MSQINYLDRDLIDLVEQVDAGDVGPVALHNVNKIVSSGVISKCNVCIVDLVLRQD
jgi:hypothetical protein